MSEPNFEVAIVGGSYAGLSAALALGRASRHVNIIDYGERCNLKAETAHNLLTHDGSHPGKIITKAKKEVGGYPTVTLTDGIVVEVESRKAGFELKFEDGNSLSAKKVLFATGIRDLLPNIPGFEQTWGISMLHCPYCHGYEVMGRKTALIGNGELGFIMAMVLSQWNKDITVLTNGKAEFDAEQLARLERNHIPICEKKIKHIAHIHGKMEAIHFEDGSEMNLSIAYAKIPFEQHSALPGKLGCKMSDDGHIVVDDDHRTSVHGIYAAGDCTTNGRSISLAMAAGTVAGMFINGELTDESF